MDSFGITNIKAQKANAIKKHHQRQKIANLFRIIEVCAVLILISRFTIKFPVTIKNSGEKYLKDLSTALVSPRFVFIVGNIIVITLFAKSGKFSTQEPNDRKNDVYDEFVAKSERIREIEFRENQEIKHYRRSQSEKSKCTTYDKVRKDLRRTVTEKKDVFGKKPYPEDNMSNEEFRKTVESFIARQQRSIREEECV